MAETDGKQVIDKQKYNYFGVVIDEPKENPLDLHFLEGIEQELHGLQFAFLATIIHDQDKHDNGEPKRRHLHAFFQVAEPLTKGQALKWLIKALKLVKEQVSMEGSNSEILLVQYLTHQNHPEKAQYPAERIKTNNPERLRNLLAKKYEKPASEEDGIQKAIQTCKTVAELMATIGPTKASRYRALFNQVREEEGRDLEAMARRYAKANAHLKDAVYQLRKLVGLWKSRAIQVDDIREADFFLESIKEDIEGF